MARAPKIVSATVLRFVAPDDDAIGVGSDELDAAYTKYIETADERVLKLTKAADFYYVRPFNDIIWQRIQDVFFDEDLPEKTPKDLASRATEIRLLYRDILDHCLIGCDNHNVVTQVNPDRSFEVMSYKWEVGKERPDGLLEALAQDRVFLNSLTSFLMAASTLTEREKNQ